MTWHNVFTTHQRWMARFLSRRGWVCFYLETSNRHCNLGHRTRDGCWLDLYQQGETYESRPGR